MPGEVRTQYVVMKGMCDVTANLHHFQLIYVCIICASCMQHVRDFVQALSLAVEAVRCINLLFSILDLDLPLLLPPALPRGKAVVARVCGGAPLLCLR